ncbi:hypothetical protein DIPPA_27723 [Diplonema papillatum]|nr:hypothetical protein DIPPA_27723 [Diplonema papillatum]
MTDTTITCNQMRKWRFLRVVLSLVTIGLLLLMMFTNNSMWNEGKRQCGAFECTDGANPKLGDYCTERVQLVKAVQYIAMPVAFLSLVGFLHHLTVFAGLFSIGILIMFVHGLAALGANAVWVLTIFVAKEVCREDDAVFALRYGFMVFIAITVLEMAQQIIEFRVNTRDLSPGAASRAREPIVHDSEKRLSSGTASGPGEPEVSYLNPPDSFVLEEVELNTPPLTPEANAC